MADQIEELLFEINRKLSVLDDVKAQVNELVRTVRGFNGMPGLVTEVALLRDKINDHIEQTHREHNEKDKDHEPEVVKGSGYITWHWVVDKLVTTVATTAILYFLFQVIPHVSVATGGAMP